RSVQFGLLYSASAKQFVAQRACLFFSQTNSLVFFFKQKTAYEMAGLGPEDVDVVQIYDAFTINVIVGLEDLGFCAKGEGGRVVDRDIGPGGKLPVNTSGGGLRYCHPGMFGIFLLIEAVRQL